VVDEGLVLQQLLYADEVRDIGDVDIPDAKVAPQELTLANQLIDSITVDGFDPDKYRDEVKERIEQQIQKKVEGEQITVPETGTAAPQGAKVIDIMEALRASLKGAGKTATAANDETSTTKKAPAKRAARKTASKAAKKGRKAA
jgi:DNA end-binding protein Ku